MKRLINSENSIISAVLKSHGADNTVTTEMRRVPHVEMASLSSKGFLQQAENTEHQKKPGRSLGPEEGPTRSLLTLKPDFLLFLVV